MSGEKEKYEWLKQNVNPILHKLVVDCVVKQPDDVVFLFYRLEFSQLFINSWILCELGSKKTKVIICTISIIPSKPYFLAQFTQGHHDQNQNGHENKSPTKVCQSYSPFLLFSSYNLILISYGYFKIRTMMKKFNTLSLKTMRKKKRKIMLTIFQKSSKTRTSSEALDSLLALKPMEFITRKAILSQR